MNYKKENIKNGITFHKINTNKFKTNLFAIFLTTKLDKQSVTKNALLTAVLRRGTKNLPTQELISKKLENMYGASFDCGVEKSGDNYVMKFYVETINNEFLPVDENLSIEGLNILLDIVCNPYIENDKFKEEYVDGEKEGLKQIIESKIDNKAKYASDRCLEEMYKNEPYGVYKYGYVDELEQIDSKILFEHYKNILNQAKIDIFVSGNIDDELIDNLKQNEMLQQLSERNANYNINKENNEKQIIENPNIINESMQIAQGKLILGLDVLKNGKEEKYATSVYNVILGGSANSKMFQNVREKASLAYTAGSIYLRVKDNIFIRCGIDIPNYEKAIDIIKEQLQQMKDGDFTKQDIENAKTLIEATVKSIPETQDSEISYYFGQELSEEFISIEDYILNIDKVTKEQIIDIANNIQINTIYFLKD